MDELSLKECTKCGQVYPLDSFAKRKSAKDGHSNICKSCVKASRQRNKAEKPQPKWKPYGWLGEYLGYSKLAECIIVTEKKGKNK